MRNLLRFSRYPILWYIMSTACCFLPATSISQTTFSDEIIIVGHTQSPYSVHANDIDGDGFYDVLSATYSDDKIAWYESIDGDGNFGQQRVITEDAEGAYSVFSIDLDSDEDIDVLSASWDGKIAWYENLDGSGNFGEQQVLFQDAEGAAYSVFSKDFDNDGDNDILYSSQEIGWFENTDGLGNFGPRQIIDTIGARQVFSEDIDGDGDFDVLAASSSAISWYENTNGQGDYSAPIIITDDVNGGYSVYSIDLDGDGDNDVLSASRFDNKFAWYENIDGIGGFGDQNIITTGIGSAWYIFSIDIDNDGDNDVLAKSFGQFCLYENVDGMGQFVVEATITADAEGYGTIFSLDLDNDGDNDILVASENRNEIVWFENIDGVGSFGNQINITTGIMSPKSAVSFDLDGDGDNDVISASNYDIIGWFENVDGFGTFSDQQIIALMAGYPTSVYCADFDGDMDLDVLASSKNDDEIAWYENIDGLGEFGDQNIITTGMNHPNQIYSIDLDGDGDNDVLSASGILNSTIAWYENLDGNGDFSNPNLIATNFDGITSIFSIDLDGDDDNDILTSYEEDSRIIWYENVEGGQQHLISDQAFGVRSVYSVDIDADGDNDVLAALNDDDRINWYENEDGEGSFGPAQIVSLNAEGADCVYSVDLDGDEDFDVLVASNGSWNNWEIKISWHENTDGLGNFGDEQLIILENSGSFRKVFSADLDGDGDNDILAVGSSKIVWFRNELLELPPAPPYPFNLVHPDSGSMILSQEVILGWEQPFDPNHDISYYLIYVSDSLDNLEGSFIDSTGSFVTNFTFTGEFDTQYWWTVLARDGEGNETWAEQVYSFTTIHPGLPPLPFNLLQPDSGLVIDSIEVVLEWEETTDPDDNFSHYRVFISENPDELEDNLAGNTTLTNFTFTGELVTEYWWTISAHDDLENETWANQVNSFSIFNGHPPVQFNLLSPDSGAVFDSLVVLLEWEESSDPDDDFALYRIYVSEYPDSIDNFWVGGSTNTSFTYTGEIGREYWWTVSARDERNNITWANQVYSFTIDLTSVDEVQPEIPTEYELTSIYPNPFNPSTTITIGMPETSLLQLNVYNILGQHVSTLASNQFTAGYHSFTLDGSSLPSGIYFVSANVKGKLNQIRKVVLMK